MRGKTIKLYIMGNEYKNLKTAELSNWTGKVYIGERKHSKMIQKIEELSVPGIYFLLSKSKDSFQNDVYIGEADEVKKRINNHFSQKDWWENFIIFTSKDSNLTKAHVRYLEKKVYLIAKENITSINLRNLSEPTGSKLPNSDIDDMEDYLENMMFVLKNLGILNLAIEEADPILIKPDDKKELENVFELTLTSDRVDENGNILSAQLIITKDGYKLLNGSYIEGKMRKSFENHTYYPLRKKLENEGLLFPTRFEEIFQIKEDVSFSSVSAAASIVKNRATNGRKEWLLKDGTTIDEFESN